MHKYQFLIFVALVISVGIAYYQYFFKVKKFNFRTILFVIKLLSFFLLLLLLINPKVQIAELKYEKPILKVLVDNSLSIKHFNEVETVNQTVTKILKSSVLQDKFEIHKFSFSNDIDNADSLTYAKSNTNIFKSIQSSENLFDAKIAPTILISDGNQTVGTDYGYFKSKNPIYPILVGDTTKYTDVSISQLNVNRYSFLENKFPVEVILNYEGNDDINTQFTIQKEGKTVFRKNVSFSKTKTSLTLNTSLVSSEEGLQFYKAKIIPLTNEKNRINNEKTFSVEVINEQTKILLLTSILHPDLGVLKKSTTTNKQHSLDIVSIADYKENVNDYQLVILYQPNGLFANVIKDIKDKNCNFWLITGTATEWDFINSQNLGVFKNAINNSESYLPNFNASYVTFLQDDIGFNNFPPLIDKFGKVNVDEENQTLLYQNINGINTEDPLLTTFSKNEQKTGILLGENIWKWRATSYLQTNSFNDFDKFIGNIIQYLASTKKRNRLEINSEPVYAANSIINFTAFYTDKNYKFDPRANLEITITNTVTNVTKRVPFSLNNTSYQVAIENLPSGDYDFMVNVLGQNISKKGKFTITNYNIEEQFTSANLIKMNQLAVQSSGKLFFSSQIDEMIEELKSNTSFVTLQKQILKEKELIDWHWILVLIILSFTTEWFIRKYIGKI